MFHIDSVRSDGQWHKFTARSFDTCESATKHMTELLVARYPDCSFRVREATDSEIKVELIEKIRDLQDSNRGVNLIVKIMEAMTVDELKVLVEKAKAVHHETIMLPEEI